MIRLGRYGAGPLAALGSVIAAALILSWSIVRAVTLEPVPAHDPSSTESVAEPAPHVAASAHVDVAAVVERDPFHPERRRPTQRFRLPSERAAGAGQRAPTLDSVELLGTTVYGGGGGSAVVRESAGLVRTLRVGDTVNGHTLRRVERGIAVFVAPGGVIVSIEARKPGG